MTKLFAFHYVERALVQYDPAGYGPVQGSQFGTFGLEWRQVGPLGMLWLNMTCTINPMNLPQMCPHVPCGSLTSFCLLLYSISSAKFAECRRIFFICSLFIKLPHQAGWSTLVFCCLRYICWFLCASFFIPCLCLSPILFRLIIIIIITIIIAITITICHCSLVINELRSELSYGIVGSL